MRRRVQQPLGWQVLLGGQTAGAACRRPRRWMRLCRRDGHGRTAVVGGGVAGATGGADGVTCCEVGGLPGDGRTTGEQRRRAAKARSDGARRASSSGRTAVGGWMGSAGQGRAGGQAGEVAVEELAAPVSSRPAAVLVVAVLVARPADARRPIAARRWPPPPAPAVAAASALPRCPLLPRPTAACPPWRPSRLSRRPRTSSPLSTPRRPVCRPCPVSRSCVVTSCPSLTRCSVPCRQVRQRAPGEGGVQADQGMCLSLSLRRGPGHASQVRSQRDAPATCQPRVACCKAAHIDNARNETRGPRRSSRAASTTSPAMAPPLWPLPSAASGRRATPSPWSVPIPTPRVCASSLCRSARATAFCR